MVFIVAKSENSNDKQMWYIHTREYYSTIKRNEEHIHVIIWLNIENIILSERTQTQTPFI